MVTEHFLTEIGICHLIDQSVILSRAICRFTLLMSDFITVYILTSSANNRHVTLLGNTLVMLLIYNTKRTGPFHNNNTKNCKTHKVSARLNLSFTNHSFPDVVRCFYHSCNTLSVDCLSVTWYAHLWSAGRSLEGSGQVRIWRLLGQGQGHRSKKAWNVFPPFPGLSESMTATAVTASPF